MTPTIRNIYIHLANVIDPDSAERIMRELSVIAGGERVTIPSPRKLDILHRRQRIKIMRIKQQYSVANLATIFGISESTVKKDLLSEPFVLSEEDTQ